MKAVILTEDTGCTHAGCQGDTVRVDPRQAEVCDLHLPAAAQQNVAGLQVTVHDGIGVEEVEALQQLPHQVLTGEKEAWIHYLRMNIQ